MTSILTTCGQCGVSTLTPANKYNETSLASLHALSKSLPKSIWHTNDPAPPGLRSDISRIIAGGEKEVASIKAAISTLIVALKELYQARDTVQGLTHKHKSLVSPLRTLPSEILSEIFTYAVDRRPSRSSRLLDPTQTLHVHKGVWTLSRVCSRWRRLVQGDARLWTRIDLHAKSLARARDPVSILRTYLSHSRDKSLVIDCSFSSYPAYMPAPNAAAGVIRLLWEHASRWRKASYHFADCDPRVWEEIKHSTYDRLEEIHIRFGRSVPPDAAVAFDKAPLLRRCSFKQVYSLPPNLKLPLRQLTLYLGPCRIGQTDVLPSLTDVEHLQLTDYSSGPVVHLPHLRHLCVKNASVVDRLVAPNLEELSAYHLISGMQSTVDMLRRSKCDSLHVLQTSFIHFPLQAILEIVTLSPKLHDLRIAVQPEDATQADEFFQRMFAPVPGADDEEKPPDASPLVTLAPELRRVTYAFYGDRLQAPESFIQFLKSRVSQEPRTLKEATLLLSDRRYHEKNPALQRSIKELAKAGLKLKIMDVHLAFIGDI
ncbi:uncharacterized protein SCHCODRAFT_01138629 [Schizophyllum commune H4-8]|nr:uncharacterized protein SCHCODRAFT_01138629 [Schizophyllum commune H4-8]KAI5893056.1 hypothetical protein SCHCODRAFT_01138629 [Schizophyllum commune H4-8]